ncbi:MAG: hypothetical protein LLF76_04900 [Planctomycetaceae bacterium]|nr:hypothetical protein [Planctomycetaceae bacterium]
MRPAEKEIKRLFDNLNDVTRPALDDRILSLCTAELKNCDPAKAVRYNAWSTFMKNPFTKFAAAAAVFLAVILGFTFFPNSKGSNALAGVIDSLKNAACVSYDITIGKDTPPIHDTVMGNVIRREVLGQTVVIDLGQMRMMTLSPETKQAVYISMEGLPEMPKNYIEHLIHVLEPLRESKEGTFERLEPRQADDRRLEGYVFKYQSTEAEIWIDSETRLPQSIIERTGGMELICKNFDFTVEADPALFAMTPPEGYTVIDTQGMIDFKKDATEEAFINGLRFLAHLRDGMFPRDISLEAFVRDAEEIGRLVEQKFEGTLAQVQAGMQLGKSLVFLRFYSGRGPWHYAGNGVRLGDANEPIFWYPPKDSDKYHIIFGDLHVEEAAQADLEAIVSRRSADMKYGYQLWDRPELTWQQEDLWRVKAGGIVEVRSLVSIRQGPRFIHSFAMTLPIEGAELVSAMLGEAGLPFEKKDAAGYVFFPDGEQLAAGADEVELIWQFGLDTLATADHGYTVGLKSCVPVTSYKLAAMLEPDSGYVWAQTPEELAKSIAFSKKLDKNYAALAAQSAGEPPLVLFTKQGKPESEFGTCGLPIGPRGN